MVWHKMKLEYASIYESVLTNQEILDLVRLNESDLAQGVLSKMPLRMREAMVVGQQEMMLQTQQPSMKVQQEIEAAVQKAAQYRRAGRCEGDRAGRADRAWQVTQ